MPGFTTLVHGLSFTESPRWRDGRLYFSDFHTHRVLAVTLDGKLETVAQLEGQPGGIGWLPDGRMLIAQKHERKVMVRDLDGTLSLYADLWNFAPWHVNEMLVDSAGRAWVGNYGFDLDGGAPACLTGLICLERDEAGLASAWMSPSELCFPNGMALTEDGGTLIVAESFGNRLSAYEVSGGVLRERRTWAAFGKSPTTADVGEIFAQAEVVPDGICLDSEGAVWVADVPRGRVIRVEEGGRILEERKTDGVPVFAVMLGGEDGRTLFVCAAPEFSEEKAAASHRASILTTRVEVPGAGLP